MGAAYHIEDDELLAVLHEKSIKFSEGEFVYEEVSDSILTVLKDEDVDYAVARFKDDWREYRNSHVEAAIEAGHYAHTNLVFKDTVMGKAGLTIEATLTIYQTVETAVLLDSSEIAAVLACIAEEGLTITLHKHTAIGTNAYHNCILICSL